MNKLGFGLMRLPTQEIDGEKKIDIAHLKEMVDTFLARGFTYFDTAWMYCNFQSECAIREALVERHPRESYTLATKLHCAYVKTKEDRDRIFGEQLKKTGVSYFDYYLLHAIGRENYPTYTEMDCFAWLKEKKEAGLVRHMGFSYHDDAEFLDQVLTEHPEMEFVQLQINYLDWDSDGVQSRKCYEVATRHGVPVIVMEPVKGGTLANVPEAVADMFKRHRPDLSVASWAVRFTADLDNVFMVLSGMSNMEQLLDNTSYMMERQPLSEAEQEIIRRAVGFINGSIAIPCTGCAYCVDGCPVGIPIPQYFSLYNADKQEIPGKSWTPQESYYVNLTKEFGAADQCLECGHCEQVCPQHLPIIQHLKEVAEHYKDA